MTNNAFTGHRVDLRMQLATSFMLINFRHLLPVQAENRGGISAAKRNLNTVVMSSLTDLLC